MRKKKSLFHKLCLLSMICSLLLSAGACSQAAPVSVKGAKINEKGELILSYSDDTEQNLGVVVGKDGKDGIDGKDGMDGKDGLDGKDGIDGKDGVDGKDGTDGKDGLDGKDGTDGKDGVDGTDGTDGSVTVINKGSNVAYATSQGLQSAVSIVCYFTPKKVSESILTVEGRLTSSGSGVIYRMNRAKGEAFIITNYHVVHHTDSADAGGISNDINVYLYGSELEEMKIQAEYVGGSAYYDIAVLHVKNSPMLKKSVAKAVTVADSDKIAVGEAAIAVGNAKGEGTSASYGVVSVDSEYITLTALNGNTLETQSFRVVRVDTPVNPGNSGGGLYNESGELIGIVNAKIIDNSVENIGYAIPSNVAVYVADNIIDHCFNTSCTSVQRGMVGIMVQVQESCMKLEKDTGRVYLEEKVGIVEIVEGGLMEGKLKAGDILKSISFRNETIEVTRQFHVVDAMLKVREGDEVTIGVLRDGKEVTVKVTMTKEHISDY